MFEFPQLLLHSRENSTILVLLAIVLIFAFRKEIGDWFFGHKSAKEERPRRHWRRH